jgi:hypothetical protein
MTAGLLHVRSGGDALLDLVGIHVEAAHQDHVLLAVHDPEVAVLVHLGDVAGVQPAVRQRLGLLGRCQ